MTPAIGFYRLQAAEAIIRQDIELQQKVAFYRTRAEELEKLLKKVSLATCHLHAHMPMSSAQLHSLGSKMSRTGTKPAIDGYPKASNDYVTVLDGLPARGCASISMFAGPCCRMHLVKGVDVLVVLDTPKEAELATSVRNLM